MIHYAKLEKSKRLQNTLNVLADCKPHSAFTIQAITQSMAVHTDIAELRANGFDITQFNNGRTSNGRLISMYQLMSNTAQMEMAI